MIAPTYRLRSVGRLLAGVALVLVPLAGRDQLTVRASATLSANATVFATGLNHPRGLAFGPDGSLYVAEAGTGGSSSTVGKCTQVPAPIGPYTGGMTARISKISASGTRTTVVDKLPSSQTSPKSGADVSGVAAVAFLDGTLYALISGGGCSHGLAGTSNEIIRVQANGSSSPVANLSAFLTSHPATNPDPLDFEPDGTWIGLAAANHTLYVTEPNHQEIDQIAPDGAIKRLIDFSATYPGPLNWYGPTGLISAQGKLYTGFLTSFPVVVGVSNISQITMDGHASVVAGGLTTVLDVAVHKGQLYALETTTIPGFPGPNWAGKGKVVRVTPAGTLVTIASGLTLPTAMTFGPDGALYVANFGFGTPAGSGQIVRVTVPAM